MRAPAAAGIQALRGETAVKKTGRMAISFLLVLAYLLGAPAYTTLNAAGASGQPPAYVQEFTGKDATVGNLMYARLLAGRLSDIDGLAQRNTLTLGEDGYYELIKTFSNTRQPEFRNIYRFTGTYTRAGSEATLHTPVRTSASVDWGALAPVFPGQSGEFTHLDSLAYPRAFNTPFLGDDNGDNDMSVLLSDGNGTFEITGNRPEAERYSMFDAPTSRDGMSIYGNFTLPKGSGGTRWPLVVLAHGFAGNQAMLRDISVMFAQRGIASYRFDFTGGSPFGSMSGGSFFDMSLLTEKEDLLAVLDFVKTQPFVDAANVFLFGESMGGAVAAMAAARRADDVRGQMLYYPAFSISEQARAVYKTAGDIPERAGTSAGIAVARKFYADALTIDIFPEIAGYSGPVLIFHGEDDTVVPPLYALKAQDYLENAELVLYTDEGHGFTRATRYRTIAKMIAFVEQTMVTGSAGED